MILLHLALRSLWHRRLTVGLASLSIIVSVFLILGIERVREGAKRGFEGTISRTDLIVGARGGSIPLLLYSVFRIGNPTNNISYSSFESFRNHSDVEWAVPISLGDSHRGYRVVGTDHSYFNHIKYGKNQNLEFAQGETFKDLYDAVLGAGVAESLGYKVGSELVLSHGVAEFAPEHGEQPFRAVGILYPTGTPVDQSIFVSLEAIEAIHDGWGGQEKTGDYEPQTITAFFVGLKSRLAIFHLQREINQYRNEPLSAVLPGMTLQEIWRMVAVAERALVIVSILVFAASLMGVLLILLSTLHERRREIAIFRSLGAGPVFVFSLLMLEPFLMALVGVFGGWFVLLLSTYFIQSWMQTGLGLTLQMEALSLRELTYMAWILMGALLIGIFPAIKAYRQSLLEGLTPRN